MRIAGLSQMAILNLLDVSIPTQQARWTRFFQVRSANNGRDAPSPRRGKNGDMPQEPNRGERLGDLKGKKPELLVNLCLINQHDRDVVFDGVDALALNTLEPHV